MLWVVTGFPRTGTSAMMQMLDAGGIEAFASRDREIRMSERYPHGNPAWYELELSQMRDTAFLHREVPDDCAIKMPTMYVRNVPVRPITLIWMHRDPKQIRASALRIKLRGFEEQFPADTWEESYHETTRIMREVMEDRRSVTQIIDVQHSDLMANPVQVARRIGIPDSAAQVILRAA